MYLWDGALHNLSSQDKEWIHHSIRVFEGDFTDPRDLNRIVDTCLGLWATAYYTHRVIVGSGEITPESNQRLSSFNVDTSYADHVRKGLSHTFGSVKLEAEGTLRVWRPGSKSAKTHPASQPSAETIAAATAAAVLAETAAEVAANTVPAVAPPARAETFIRSISSLSVNTTLITEKGQPNRTPSRSSERASVRRIKRRESISAEKTAMKASNTIYDIVSLKKEEIFPTEYFGDLVELIESCIDDRKIVPILRSQRNAEIVESRLNRPDVPLAQAVGARERTIRAARARSARLQANKQKSSARMSAPKSAHSKSAREVCTGVEVLTSTAPSIGSRLRSKSAASPQLQMKFGISSRSRKGSARSIAAAPVSIGEFPIGVVSCGNQCVDANSKSDEDMHVR